RPDRRSARGQTGKHLLILFFTAEPEAPDRGGSNQHPALLEREDCTLVAWYRSLYAPRTGGAYDSHHRTAGIADRSRRRCGVAGRRARAAAGDAGAGIPRQRLCRWLSEIPLLGLAAG